MKICFVTTSFPRSPTDGYSKFVLEQARSVLRKGECSSVTVITPHAPGLKLEEDIDGVRVVRFRYFWPQSQQCLAYQHEGLFETVKHNWVAKLQLPLFLIGMFICLARYSRGAQVIHAQWLPTLLVALPIAKIRRVPLFVSARGADVNMGQSALSRLVLRATELADLVFVVSDNFKQQLIRANSKTRVETLYNGVRLPDSDTRETQSKSIELGGPHTQPTLLYVGGLIHRKRLDTLIDSLLLLRNEGFTPLPFLSVAGQGPLESSLKKLVLDNELSDTVKFVGQLSQAEVNSALSASDILVLPSESEGRPNIVLEAFANSVAVIASNVSGSTELVQQGETGLLFEVGNAQELANSIKQLLENSRLRSRIATNGNQSLHERGLTWSAHGTRLLSFYNQFVSKG